YVAVPFLQVGKIWVGQADPPVLALRGGVPDVLDGQPVPDSARPRMQEQPHPVLLVEGHLDEVVTAAERAQLQPPVRRDLLSAIGTASGLKLRDPRRGFGCLADGLVVLPGRQWNSVLDRHAQAG